MSDGIGYSILVYSLPSNEMSFVLREQLVLGQVKGRPVQPFNQCV